MIRSKNKKSKRKEFITMIKLLKKITLVSTTAFILCITTTTTTNFPIISIGTENTPMSEDNEQDNHTNTENESKIQPLKDKDKPNKGSDETPLS